MQPTVSPMRVLGISELFDHPEFLFELKLNGFHACAYPRRRLRASRGTVIGHVPAGVY
jgi:hypothetical protein